jgi:hypothetical protein
MLFVCALACLASAVAATSSMDAAACKAPLPLAVAIDTSSVQQVMDGYGGAAAGGPGVWIHVMQEPQRTELVLVWRPR